MTACLVVYLLLLLFHYNVNVLIALAQQYYLY